MQTLTIDAIKTQDGQVSYVTTEGAEFLVQHAEPEFMVRADIKPSPISKFQLNPTDPTQITISEKLVLIPTENPDEYQVIVGNGRLALQRQLLGHNLTAKEGKRYIFQPFQVDIYDESEASDRLKMLQIAQTSNAVAPTTEADLIVAIRNFYEAFAGQTSVEDAQTATANYFGLTVAKLVPYIDAIENIERYQPLLPLVNRSVLSVDLLNYFADQLDQVRVAYPDYEPNLGEIAQKLEKIAALNAAAYVSKDPDGDLKRYAVSKKDITSFITDLKLELELNSEDEDSSVDPAAQTVKASEDAAKQSNKVEQDARKVMAAHIQTLSASEIAMQLPQLKEDLIGRLTKIIDFISPDQSVSIAEAIAKLDSNVSEAPTVLKSDKPMQRCMIALKTLEFKLDALESQIIATVAGASQGLTKLSEDTQNKRQSAKNKREAAKQQKAA